MCDADFSPLCDPHRNAYEKLNDAIHAACVGQGESGTVRFDDRLKTVLKGNRSDGLAAAMQWRQIIDLLAQKPESVGHGDVQAGLTRLRDLYDHVSLADRKAAVAALDRRIYSPPLLVFLCADEPAVARIAMAAARLTPAQWTDIAPHLPAFLREEFAQLIPAIAAPATTQFAAAPDALEPLPAAMPSVATPDPADQRQQAPSEAHEQGQLSQIGELVARIGSYQKNRAQQPAAVAASFDHNDAAECHRLDIVADDMGTITLVDGDHRTKAMLVGVSIATPAEGDGPGPDAAAAAAFRQRRPIRNARLRLLGDAAIAGIWKLTAQPYFSEQSGRFLGYRGTMLRPDIAEMAMDLPVSSAGLGLEIGPFVHELRTPLNAIMGFSEIIEQQLFGPVAADYRAIAQSIHREAKQLLDHIEDIKDWYQDDGAQDAPGEAQADFTQVLKRIADRLQPLTTRKNLELSINRSEPLRPFAVPFTTLERLLLRLFAACINAADQGEKLSANVRTQPGANVSNILWIDRPTPLLAMSETDLLNLTHEIEPGNDQSPLLGLGFSFRLIRNLAQSAGGRLMITEDRIVLTLPAADYSQNRRSDSDRE